MIKISIFRIYQDTNQAVIKILIHYKGTNMSVDIEPIAKSTSEAH